MVKTTDECKAVNLVIPNCMMALLPFSSFSTWDWLNVLGPVLVLIGVGWELRLLKHKLPKDAANLAELESDKHNREARAVMLVVAGVLLELVVVPHSLKEVAELNSANLKMRKEVVDLEAKAKPRRITPEQKNRFINFLKDRPKGPVKIYVGRLDDEATDFTMHVRDVLDAAGYGTGTEPGIVNIGDRFSMYGAIGFEAGVEAKLFMWFYGTNLNTLTWPGLVIKQRDDRTFFDATGNGPNVIPYWIGGAFSEIGLIPAAMATTNGISAGEWALYIRKKF